MALTTLSDPFLIVAFQAGLATVALIILISLQIIYLRGALRRYERREKQVIIKWRPLLNSALMDGRTENLPHLHKTEHIGFLKLWVHLHLSVRGKASKEMNEIGYQLDCDAIAREMVSRGNRSERLLAVMALGLLRDTSAWPSLLRQADLQESTTSIYALWALFQIDPSKAARQFVPILLQRSEWALSQVVKVLWDAREECEPVLIEAVAEMDATHLPRALHLMEALRINLCPSMLSNLLEAESLEVVIAALRIVTAPDLLDKVRRHLTHGDWRVRAQASRAIGRIGDASDVDALRLLLNDPQWWVRYRAAQALVSMPFVFKSDIEKLYLLATDRFAVDMLKQAIAERDMGWK